MRPATTAFVSLGANLGDAAQAVCDAMDAIDALPETAITRRSSLYRTAPVDAGGPDYVNAVAELSTQLQADELMVRLQAIEDAAGRERPYRNAPRTLDLDILLYGDFSIATPSLTVPHPRMHERAFVLQPLVEISPETVIPGHGSAHANLQLLKDQPCERIV
jgi:2-amino-4-hydroxy-6-hydroxymethyldihydropteridine diphosphokinase